MLLTRSVHVSLLLFLWAQSGICFFDPATLGIGAAIGLGVWGFGFVKEQTYCRIEECCDRRRIPGNIAALYSNLQQNLFGQHIVLQQLVPALEAHLDVHSKSRKPLVISFHGTPGTGKNFVADHIVNALYEKGMNSKFVHKYLGRADFEQDSKAYEYKARINRDVRAAIAACPRSLFIFDEVDKMPAGVFESLTSLVDYNPVLNGADFTKAIFIFLSNTAGVRISDRLGKLIKGGTLREETKLSDFENILEKAAYNLEGGLKKTSLIEAHVIDHYIPFLPLEKTHVSKCLKAEFRRWGKRPDEKTIEMIIQNTVTYDRDHGLFATSGCKKLDKKVAVEVMSPPRQ